MQSNNYTLLPEWAQQEAVILSWPHENTDWSNNLEQTRATYLQLITAINKANAVVILLCPDIEINALRDQLSEHQQVLIVPANYNDTWVRDYGFLTVSDNQRNYPISFTFNGWGEKFDAGLDNRINLLLANLCQHPLIIQSTVLEGGAIEIDENQHLLTTASCLFNPKRNGRMTAEQYTQLFADFLGAKKVSIFNHGHLEGDDTDGHIDTLARFTPLMGVVMQGADNCPQDSHFAELFKLQNEVSQVLPKHTIYSLPLPFMLNEDGDRLPASYANFLILNEHILMPVYHQPEDEAAVEIVQKAYPNYQIIEVSCASLVQQFGSLHCISMQVPTNTLIPEIIEQAQSGVTVLAAK